jgi:2-dehydro-3-deoxyphosphogluconate aldolase / (4S)-4-hydroxy-2-oxoglutarate aldolase
MTFDLVPSRLTPFDEIFAGRIMAILRGIPPEETVRLSELAWSLGIDAVEVPIGRPDQVASLRAAVVAGRAAGKLVGAGTVVSVGQVEAAVAAGAAYTVAPGLDLDVLSASRTAGLPHLPGVATPTEMQRALGAGCGWVKAFPASSLGPSWFKDVRGPFPDVRIVATGGITAETAPLYLAAGARVAAVGSALSDLSQLPALAALTARS